MLSWIKVRHEHIMTPLNDLTPYGLFLLGEEPVRIYAVECTPFHSKFRKFINLTFLHLQTIEDFILLIGTIVAFIAFVLWCCFPIQPKVCVKVDVMRCTCNECLMTKYLLYIRRKHWVINNFRVNPLKVVRRRCKIIKTLIAVEMVLDLLPPHQRTDLPKFDSHKKPGHRFDYFNYDKAAAVAHN